MKFRSKYSGQVRAAAPTGDGWENNYVYDSMGRLRKDELKTHAYEIIQSHKEECDIKAIIERAANGDPDAMSAKGIYADITGMPTSILEMQRKMADADKIWEELPKKFKANFDSKLDFMQNAGTQEWFEKIGYTLKGGETNESEHGSTLSRTADGNDTAKPV